MRLRRKPGGKRVTVSRDIAEDKRTQFRYEGAMKYAPLVLCEGFFVAIVLLFAFGPYDWHLSNGPKLFLFLGSAALALLAGYLFAARRAGGVTGESPSAGLQARSVDVQTALASEPGPRSTSRLRRILGKEDSQRNFDASMVVIVCSLVYLIIYLPTVMTTTGKVIPDLVTGLTNAGEAYRTSKYYNTHGSQTVLYIRMILGPFLIPVYPITVFFYTKLTRTARILGLSTIACTLVLGIAQGTNKAVADFTGYAVMFLVLLYISTPRGKASRKSRLAIVAAAVLIVGLFYGSYNNTMHSRIAMDEKLAGSASPPPASGVNVPPPSEASIDEGIVSAADFGFATVRTSNLIYRLMPENVRSTGMFLVSYTTHGYKGLSLAMDHPFTPSYGLGFSPFVRHNVLRILGESQNEQAVYANTYAGKTEADGWSTGLVWSTFFVNPASDITFPGTIVLMFVIGYLWSLAWRDALERDDVLAIVVFFYLSILVVYLSANNQIFEGGETTIGFTVVFSTWLVRRRSLRPNSPRRLGVS